MKAIQFVMLMLIAGSLVVVSCKLNEVALAAQNNVPAPNVAVLDQTSIENDPVGGSSFSDSTAATKSQSPIGDHPYLENQLALSDIQLAELQQVTRESPEIRVAVLDTGIDQSHEDLDGRVITGINFTDSPTLSDVYGHGTHVAGVIAANSSNGIGITGVAPRSLLMNVKVADDKGRSKALTVAKGIIWAVDGGANVINISIEIQESSPELQDAVSYAWSRGAVIVAAAGNNGSETPIYPAYYEDCIAVAATKPDGTLAPLSNHGSWIDVAAPGFNIYSTLPQDGYGYKTGTSFATAYVSGVASLLFSVVSDSNDNGRLNDEVRAAIELLASSTSH